MWTRDGGNRVIYSDDFGSSWNVLGEVTDRPAPYGDEPKIEELPDGTVVLSSRKGGGRYFNLFSFEDGAYTTGTWGTAVSSNDVQDGLSFGRNSTNGEILLVNAVRKSDGSKCDLMLQSVPTGDGRSDVSIFYKEMVYDAGGGNVYTPTSFAQDWTLGLQVSDRGSAYSTMTMQADGRVAFLYEEEPGGYCIVYAPLSIEAITGGRYVVDDKK
jgi:sialidase-1